MIEVSKVLTQVKKKAKKAKVISYTSMASAGTVLASTGFLVLNASALQIGIIALLIILMMVGWVLTLLLARK